MDTTHGKSWLTKAISMLFFVFGAGLAYWHLHLKMCGHKCCALEWILVLLSGGLATLALRGMRFLFRRICGSVTDTR